MNTTRFTILLRIIFLLILGASALRAESPISLNLQAALVDPVTREVQPMSADHQLDHDEIIEYQLVVTNRGTTEVKGLQPMIPVPESCVFTGYCDAPETVSVVDASGEAHVLMPLLENAEAANREAVLATKAVRWTVASLAPGQSLTLSAQVVFLPRHPSQVQLAQD